MLNTSSKSSESSSSTVEESCGLVPGDFPMPPVSMTMTPRWNRLLCFQNPDRPLPPSTATGWHQIPREYFRHCLTVNWQLANPQNSSYLTPLPLFLRRQIRESYEYLAEESNRLAQPNWGQIQSFRHSKQIRPVRVVRLRSGTGPGQESPKYIFPSE